MLTCYNKDIMLYCDITNTCTTVDVVNKWVITVNKKSMLYAACLMTDFVLYDILL